MYVLEGTIPFMQCEFCQRISPVENFPVMCWYEHQNLCHQLHINA